MATQPIADLITALSGTYAAGEAAYTSWSQRQWERNRYSTRRSSSSSSSNSPKNDNTTATPCAVTTSLAFSAQKLRRALADGVEILGAGFAAGDDPSRAALQENLDRLRARIDLLRRATTAQAQARDHGGAPPLELGEVIRVSEAARARSLAALAGLYRRVAVGRLVPRVVVLVGGGGAGEGRTSTGKKQQQQAWVDEAIAMGPEEEEKPEGQKEDDKEASAGAGREEQRTVYREEEENKRSPYGSESPPTPKRALSEEEEEEEEEEDLQSTYTCASEFGGGGPKNSVFSAFCPEAMEYQVDVRKPMPMPMPMPERRSAASGCGRCGYAWDGQNTTTTSLLLKDGFRLTPRFLAKSHCAAGGFGCVLCTSSGKTETYATAQELAGHINDAHTKWQFLHDWDLTGR
ncbi:hypothetical protein F4780DRAFT_513450 [Xylariomycetidae sp. FL0641]|nr:hypothetical protein F4780DRAFT_513450 [Xylariomycetidae sp. FL0641]